MRGDTEYRLRCFGSAILKYKQALGQAIDEFQDVAERSQERAISQVVISYLDLAACYVAVDECDRAADCYIEAVSFLEQLLTQVGSEDEAQFAAVLHAVSPIHSLWQDFVRQYQTRLDEAQQLRYQGKAAAIFRNERHLALRH